MTFQIYQVHSYLKNNYHSSSQWKSKGNYYSNKISLKVNTSKNL